MRTIAPRALTALLVVAATLLAAPAPAVAWTADFFDGRACGQAVYEDMVIHPEAVRVGTTTYVVYQGAHLDPYLAAFPDGGVMRGPYRIGTNPLGSGSDPDDSHGAPAILVDAAHGRVRVYWGAHGSTLMQGTALLADLAHWTVSAAPFGAATYPQPSMDASGVAHMFYRGHGQRLSAAVLPNNGWWHATSSDGGATWSRAKPVLASTANTSWYAHFEPGAGGRIHLFATTQDETTPDPLARHGAYYAVLDTHTGRWKDAAGHLLGAAGVPLVLADVASTATVCAVPGGVDPYQNGVTVAEDDAGRPLLLFVSGAESGPNRLRWVFARWDGGAWVTRTIARTDFLMDSSALEFRDGGIDAYLTVGGAPWWTPVDPYDYRGGDIVRYRSDNDGATWSRDATIAMADPARGLFYNDPQLVQGHDADGPRLVYSEWDNDAGAMLSKTYLWGPDGFAGTAFAAHTKRLSGASRYDTAVAISKEAFPNGSDTVIVASGQVFTDSLAGGPLAQADHAPLLLVQRNAVPAAVKAELKRLKARTVIVLGGPGTVTAAASNALRVGLVTKVRRIWGADRYSTAAAIAREVVAAQGRRGVAFVASGERFADGLSASSVAAASGVPVLLVRRGSVPNATDAALASLGVTRTVVVGGPATVSTATLGALPGAVRVSGADRYATSAAAAQVGLDGIPGVLRPCLRTDRFSIASGEAFADALAAAALAARTRGPLLLTRGDFVPPATAALLSSRGIRVLDCYVVGGPATILPATAATLSGLVH